MLQIEAVPVEGVPVEMLRMQSVRAVKVPLVTERMHSLAMEMELH